MRPRNRSKPPPKVATGINDAARGKRDSERTQATNNNQNDTVTHSRENSGGSLKLACSGNASKVKKRERFACDGDSDDKAKFMTKQYGMQEEERGSIFNDVDRNTNVTRHKEEDAEQSIQHLLHIRRQDVDEIDWEDGSISSSSLVEGHSVVMGRGLTVEFCESVPSTKRASKRASAEEKEVAELVHKAHLLCLLARGRLVDSACDDPLIQASLLSLLPPYLLNATKIPILTTRALGSIVNWFRSCFHVRSGDFVERSFRTSLAHAIENRKGTAEEVAALSVVLFRSLNLTTRFVSILDVASLKPVGDSNQDIERMSTGTSTNLMKNISLESSRRDGVSIGENELCCNIGQVLDLSATKNDILLESSAGNTCHSNDVDCSQKKIEGSKRKGDVEFELQLQMALNATAAGANVGLSGQRDEGSSSSHLLSSEKQVKRNLSPSEETKAVKRIRTDGPSVSAERNSTAVWSRQLGPPLYWAEVFFSGEALTGRWVHVDAANAVIDGEQKVEAAAAACRRSLRYVVAFAGSGAKDVTRRYCTKWHTIAPKRINQQWWDAVLSPLKMLESGATGGVVPLEVNCRNGSSDVQHPGHLSCTEANKPLSSLEDLELETRALTEPLPTNQQAYKNHHLYAIERWLAKYEILRPKGPILGYCSGHPVYPRTCVETLQTKQGWLKVGLQIKADERPVKVVKHKRKFGKSRVPESNVCDEDDGEDVLSLFGKWQTEPLCLPHAENGKVPKNERGQVDVWSEKCLPPGTVHLRLPRLVPVVKRLEIDFAPAMVGFEFRNGRSIPIFEGIVVCTEFRDAIMEAYAEEEERREAEGRKRDESRAIVRWYQLLSNIITRQRLKNTYEIGSSSQANDHANRTISPSQFDGDCQTCKSHQKHVKDAHSSKYNQRHVKDAHSGYQLALSVDDHEHVFPMEDQSFDEASSVWTKRCPCGFTVEMEEM